MSGSPTSRRRPLIRSLLAICAGAGVSQIGRFSSVTPYPSGPSPVLAQGPVRLSATGASFATPLYESWFVSYLEDHPNLRLTYTPGSFFEGITALQEGTVDFAMSDGGITEEQARQVRGGVLVLPIVAGAVGIAYNIPGVAGDLRLTRRLLSDIYLGHIRAWNDERIATLNPAVKLPSLPITVLYRAQANGYNQVLTRHLSAISRDWAAQVGTGPTVDWPMGQPVRANQDLTRQLALTLGGITAVGLEAIIESPLTLARLENKAGKFVQPIPTTIASGLSTVELSSTLQGFQADPPGQESYPLVTYTWILTHRSYGDPEQVEALKDLLSWCLREGQPIAAESGYVPLSDSVAERSRAGLEAISVPT